MKVSPTHHVTKKGSLKKNPSKTSTQVRVYNYNSWTTFPSISEAKKFYLDAMRMSEGAERDRYTRIYLQLEDGKTVASDEVDY